MVSSAWWILVTNLLPFGAPRFCKDCHLHLQLPSPREMGVFNWQHHAKGSLLQCLLEPFQLLAASVRTVGPKFFGSYRLISYIPTTVVARVPFKQAGEKRLVNFLDQSPEMHWYHGSTEILQFLQSSAHTLRMVQGTTSIIKPPCPQSRQGP